MIPPSSGSTEGASPRGDLTAGPTLYERNYLKPGDVAKRLGLTASAVYKMAKDGKLPSIRISDRTVRIPAGAFEAYLRRRETGSLEPTVLRDEDRTAPQTMTLEECKTDFERRAGRTPAAFLAAWKRDEIEDSPENAELAIEALSLREDVRERSADAAVGVPPTPEYV